MIRSLCYNIIYMRMEEPEVGAASTGSVGAPDIDSLLRREDPSPMLMEQLRAMGSTDQDVQELLAYFEALLKLRGGNAAT